MPNSTFPQGYGRLIMISDNVDGLRQARSKVGHSLRIASMEYSPRGLANGNGKRLSGGDGNVREKVKFPADLNQKQREKLEQILVGGINFENEYFGFIEGRIPH